MIGDREQVYENIRTAVSLNQLNSKVEPGDPKLLREDKEALLRHYIDYRTAYGFCVKKYIAEAIFHAGTSAVGLITQVDGLENLSGIRGPAIVTCNHFSPLDPAIVRFAMRKAGFRRISIVNQDSNLAMKGFVGYMQKYADTMPVSSLKWFMETEFPNQIKNALDENKLVLIYPEQEMWFNYRKPRPCKRGAFRVHVLPVIYPDRQLDERTASLRMQHTDYEQKCAAYVMAYGKKLTYDFEEGDIVGR